MVRNEQAGTVRRRTAAAALVALICMLPARSMSDQASACVQAMVRSMEQVTQVRARGFLDCARKTANGLVSVPDGFDECMDRKEQGAMMRHALEGTVRRETQYCTPVPDFGDAGADAVNRAASDLELQISGDTFGAPVASGLATMDTDSSAATCQLTTVRGYSRLRAAALMRVLRCAQAYASSGADWTAEGLGACVEASRTEALATLEAAEGKFKVSVSKACSGVPPTKAFPGACSGAADSDAAAACLAQRSRCRSCRATEIALGVVADCETFDNGVADGSCPASTSACGNGIVDEGETCDRSDLAGKACTDLGYASGTLGCTSACTFDLSECTQCGNGQLDPDEECDGSELDGSTCQSLGYQTGQLGCTDQCTFDTAGCTVCGDGAIGGAEQCDGTNLGNHTCLTEGFDSGSLSCKADCQLDTTNCDNCGDGQVGSSEQCDGTNLNGASCAELGYVAGDLGCSNHCTFDTSLCFATCNVQNEAPADLKFGADDSLWLFGDSITQAFHETKYHFGRILARILGATYCAYAEQFSVFAVGHKGSTYAHYASYVRHALPAPTGNGHQWVMFQDSGKTVKLRNDRFQNAVRKTIAAAREINPDASVMLATTPPLEESPERPGICHYYSKMCNFAAHNDIVTSQLSDELEVDAVPWNDDFCRLIHHRQDIFDLEYTLDGIHPRATGNLGLALSLLKWAGVPRADLVLNNLEDLDPSLTAEEATQIADWVYDTTVYDCSQILEQCGLPGKDCLNYFANLE